MTVEDIKRIAVIGAGDMGHGIAEVALIAGIPVNLYDTKDEFVERGQTRIIESLEKLTEKGRVPAELLPAVKGTLLTTTTNLEEAVQNADLVVEAIPEVLDLKKDLFGKIDALAPKHTLFASNTSTMSITQLAAMTQRPEQVFGLHFFNPAVLMKLVEVIRGDQTNNDTINAGLALGKKLGKVPVLVRKDTPGFIANRVNAAPVTLFTTMIEMGEFEPEGIDGMLRMLGMKMGPCELTDFVGIDIAVNVMQYFAETLHPDYGPPPHRTSSKCSKTENSARNPARATSTGPAAAPKSTSPKPPSPSAPCTPSSSKSTKRPNSPNKASAPSTMSTSPSSIPQETLWAR
jgi:enoyl-CoA hydratase/3-hydroxyacyl-CoA dehydrogenase